MLERYRILVCLLLLLSINGQADTISFANGDKLQGKIISMQNGVIQFESANLGKLEIALDKVASFATEQAAELHFEDGTVLNRKVMLSEQGEVALDKGEIVSANSVALAKIKEINPPQAEPVSWEGRFSGGIVIDRGNSESQDVQMQVNATRETEEDRIILDAEHIEKRETNPDTGEESTSKRRYALGAHYDYFVSPKYYVYGDVNAEKETTANLDLRLTIGGGGGYRWIKTKTTKFDVESGLSWVNESFSDQSEDTDYISARFAWRFTHDFTPSVHFFHSAEWFPSLEDSEDQLIKTETGVRSKINSHLFMEAKILFDWDQTPADGAEKEDSSYILGIGWDF